MTTNIELDNMRADQLASNCPCGETVILTLAKANTDNMSVGYFNECRPAVAGCGSGGCEMRGRKPDHWSAALSALVKP